MIINGFDELNAGIGKDGMATGDECFVIVASHVASTENFQRTFKCWPAKAARQFFREGHLQVQTDAAKLYHRSWKHMSFRHDTGMAIIDRCARLLVAETMAEQAALQALADKTACKYEQDLPMPVSPRHLSIAETPRVADAAPRSFGLFQAPEDFE